MMETVPQTLPFSKGRGVRSRGLVEDRLHKTLLVYRYLLATFQAWREQQDLCQIQCRGSSALTAPTSRGGCDRRPCIPISVGSMHF